MPQKEYKVRGPALFVLFVLFVRKLAGVVFKDGIHGLDRGGVKENDRCDVFPKRFRNACYLLGQNPHAYATVTRAETKIYQLARAAFHIFRSGAVIDNDERVRGLEKVAG